MKIQTRFGLLMLLLGVMLATAFITSEDILLRDRLEANQEDWIDTVVRAVAESVTRDVINEEHLHTRDLLQRVVSEEAAIDYMFVTDFEGLLFAHSFEGGFPRALAERLATEEGPADAVLATESGRLVEFDAPLIEGMGATLHIGVSQKEIDATIEKAQRDGIFIVIASLSVTLAIAFLAGSRINRPLQDLAQQLRRFGETGSAEQVQVKTTDPDIRQLARAFNDMSAARKTVERDLRRAEDRFRQIFEVAEIGNFVVDDNGMIEATNVAAQRMFGYPADEITGRSICDLLGEVEREAANPNEYVPVEWQRLKGMSGSEMIGCAKDGTKLNVLVGVGLMRSDDRDRYALSIADQTEQSRLREQLSQSQRLESIGKLTGGIAHDFNNLLAVILGNLEFLRENMAEDENRQIVDESIDATVKGSELTRNMLSFARKAPLAPVRGDLNAIVKGMEGLFSRTLPSSIELETSLPADLWPVMSDPSSTESALLNLIINARDAMPRGGKLTIETSNVRVDEEYQELRGEDITPGRYVLLAVSDTGEGIPPERLPRIFEPFFTTKPVGRGSGLGLSMLEGFMRQSHGTVRVYSEVGVGTTFKLYFPAADTRDVGSHESSRTAFEARTSNDAIILLVEDNKAVLETIQRAVRQTGHTVLTAASGQQAVATFSSMPNIDLVVTDIVMPGDIQGTDLAKILRRMRSDLPVIFMSGYASEAVVHSNGLRPEDIRLMKPVRHAELLAAIDKALAQSAAQSE